MRANFADIYLQGMRDRSMGNETELAREIQLTDWSTAGEQDKLVFVVSITPSLGQFIHFLQREKSSFHRSNFTDQFNFFTLRFLSRKNAGKKSVLTSKNIFLDLHPIRRLRVARKPV